MGVISASDNREKIQAIFNKPMLIPGSVEILDYDPYGSGELSESPLSNINREIRSKQSEGILSGLRELFSEDAEALPTCKPYLRSFMSNRMPGVMMAAELPCGGWECKKCGVKLKQTWYMKHAEKFEDEPFMEKITIDAEDWDNYSVMIRRSGGKYVKYKQHDGSLLVLTTARLGGEEIKAEDRQYELVNALKSTAYEKQPISQSRNWKSGVSAEEEEEKDWKPVDSLKYTELEELIEALKKMGIACSFHTLFKSGHGSFRALTFKLPKDHFWDTLWALGALNRGKDESRETLWEYEGTG